MRTALFMLFLLAGNAFAAGLEVAFDAANKLYEEGKYPEAAQAYEKLLAGGARSASLYYNLGTACFRAGQMGRSVAAFRQAEELTPRDPSLRAKLQFVRKQVSGDGKVLTGWWQSWMRLFTLNEGAVLAALALWAWCLLLAAGEWRPAWKSRLQSAQRAAGLLTLIMAAGLALSAQARYGTTWAVVVAREAVVRFGPIDEAQTSHPLPDGTEVEVLDTKDQWRQVRDASGRSGWVKQDQILLLAPPDKLGRAGR